MSRLATRRLGDGDGPRVLLVHGAILASRYSFFHQRPLGERWTLVAVDRPGHGDATPVPGGNDFEAEAADLAELVAGEDGGAHLVGHSYGAIVCLIAAALVPERVRSLVSIEPPAWGVAPDDAAAAAADAGLRELLADPPAGERELLAAFFEIAGVDAVLPDPLPAPLAEGARAFRTVRQPGDAELPLAALAAAPFPILSLSGGHSPAFEAVADRIAAATGARREVLAGRRHLVPDLGEPVNALLEEHWRAADAARAFA